MKNFVSPAIAPGINIPLAARITRQIIGRNTVYLTTFPTVPVPFRIHAYISTHAITRHPSTGNEIVP